MAMAYVPTDQIEIVERIADLPYSVFIDNEPFAAFVNFYDACVFANDRIGYHPTGSARECWTRQPVLDNAGRDYWTFEQP
jgi:hypothetical protein